MQRATLNASRSTPNAPRQRGMTLIDLMVGMVIGLLVVLAAVGSLVFVRGSSRTIDDSSALQQQANLALLQIGQQLSQSGSINAYPTGQNPDADTANAATGGATITVVSGSSGNVSFDTRPTGVSAATASNTLLPYLSVYGADGATPAAADTLAISYAAPNDGSPAANCAGTAPPALAGGGARVVSIFTVDTAGNLTCSTDDTAAAPLTVVPGVAALRIKYLLIDPASAAVTYQSAAQVDAAGNWGNVNGVQVCLEMVGDYTQAVQQTYPPGGDCQGNLTSPADGKLHRIVRHTFYLRNGSES